MGEQQQNTYQKEIQDLFWQLKKASENVEPLLSIIF